MWVQLPSPAPIQNQDNSEVQLQNSKTLVCSEAIFVASLMSEILIFIGIGRNKTPEMEKSPANGTVSSDFTFFQSIN
jgi:hypothetical protein